MRIAYSCLVDARPAFEWQAFLHYHAKVPPSGQLKGTGVPFVDAAIRWANEEIAAVIDAGFDNALFRSHRYASFPELGAGLGSRGDFLEHKKRLPGGLIDPSPGKEGLA